MIQTFTLVREPSRPNPGGESFTLARLYLDGKFFCHTCEDEDRHLEAGGTKAPKLTAIPRGRYRLITSFSNRFQKVLPEVLEVPQFQGVRIHGGNRAEDSKGCILAGRSRTQIGVAGCAEVVQRVIEAIDSATEAGIETYLVVE